MTCSQALGAVSLFCCLACSASAVERSPLVARTSVGGVPVEVAIEEGELVVRSEGAAMPVKLKAQPFLNEPPADPTVVRLDGATEVGADSWLDRGLVVAIETTGDDGQRHYRWATLYVDLAIRQAQPVATAEFHTTAEDLRIADVQNSQGDSIVILLSGNDHDAPEPGSVLAFQHRCPIYSGGGGFRSLCALSPESPAESPSP